MGLNSHYQNLDPKFVFWWSWGYQDWFLGPSPLIEDCLELQLSSPICHLYNHMWFILILFRLIKFNLHKQECSLQVFEVRVHSIGRNYSAYKFVVYLILFRLSRLKMSNVLFSFWFYRIILLQSNLAIKTDYVWPFRR